MHTQGNRVHWLRVFEDAKAKADSVITFSEYAKREVSEELSVDPERIHAIPLAPGDEFKPEVDSIRVQKSLDRWGLMAGRYVLSVGTLEPRKNHVTLIRSFSRLLRIADDRTLKLALVGPKGWLYEPIFREIEQLGLEQRVAWIGDADTLVALYNGAAAFVYPSIYEGFGLPPLEAMACGTPVIASSASSLPEVVGNAAILINPLDEERLCFELQRVLNDQALRQALRKRGLARAQLFTWTKTARRTLEAYATARDRASERSRLRWPQNLDRVLRYIKSGKSRGDF
jgi:glycosyltransferase involved in cell wall biosynthesis